MNKKDLYTSPEVTVFTVQTEGVVCGSPGAWDAAIVLGTDWADDDIDYGLE